MAPASVLNDVFGPIMRGPSSSHTAGAHRIATLARELLHGPPWRARFAFHPAGSYGRVYAEQGADRAFACGLLGWELTDERFPRALEEARRRGLEIRFCVEPLEGAEHPNTVDLHLEASTGDEVRARARSIGGGMVAITRLEDWPVHLRAEDYALLLECSAHSAPLAMEILGGESSGASAQERAGRALVQRSAPQSLPAGQRERLLALEGVELVWELDPLAFPRPGRGRFASAVEMIALAEREGLSLGRVALAHEADLLGLSEEEVMAEVGRRLDVMLDSVRAGLAAEPPRPQLLEPCAARILAAEAAGRLAQGGAHTRAAARALAVMHVNSAMGVVCAAPTGGSAGVLPGVLATLIEERGLSREQVLLALLAAGAVGVVFAARATFAAEVAGCQVEIGAAGAMAAAAVVEAAGGSARQGAAAAAIALQNTMGSVCDLVQGMVEIPCHTRNAAAASAAFVCADLILGGYENPIPLDDTIDASLASGSMLPRELRCTALGGLAATASARSLRRGRCEEES